MVVNRFTGEEKETTEFKFTDLISNPFAFDSWLHLNEIAYLSLDDKLGANCHQTFIMTNNKNVCKMMMWKWDKKAHTYQFVSCRNAWVSIEDVLGKSIRDIINYDRYDPAEIYDGSYAVKYRKKSKDA